MIIWEIQLLFHNKTCFYLHNLIAVDTCMLCHLDAECQSGRCLCNQGFHGDGYECKAEKGN